MDVAALTAASMILVSAASSMAVVDAKAVSSEIVGEAGGVRDCEMFRIRWEGVSCLLEP